VSGKYETSQVYQGRVTRIAPFGVFVELEPGIVGLIPASEAGLARDAELARAFPIGADVRVVVLETDASARRIRLSAKAVMEAQEAEEVREYTERADPVPEELGSLAEKLRGALKARDK
jgi:ribosomal protein S1